jgi:hypothetical protein
LSTCISLICRKFIIMCCTFQINRNTCTITQTLCLCFSVIRIPQIICVDDGRSSQSFVDLAKSGKVPDGEIAVVSGMRNSSRAETRHRVNSRSACEAAHGPVRKGNHNLELPLSLVAFL